MESTAQPEHCYTLYRPGDLDISNDFDLQSELFQHRSAMVEGLRRLLTSHGMVAETSEVDTVSTVIAAYVLEVHGRSHRDKPNPAELPEKTLIQFNGTQTESKASFEAVVEVDMNHPEFYEFRKWLYAKANRSCDMTIHTAINLFDPLIAQQFAKFLKINLASALFVVKPFDQFEDKGHVVPFVARMAQLLERNMTSETPVNTVWLFGEQHALSRLALLPREKEVLEAFLWRGVSK